MNRGLRRESFVILERFISRMENAPFAERRRFTSWVLHHREYSNDGGKLVPHQLRTRLIEPTLVEWAQAEPGSSEPLRWMGGYDQLKRAIELDPTDEIARQRLIATILNGIAYSTHELPWGYLGEPADDLADLAYAEATAIGLSGEDHSRAMGMIVQRRKQIEDYLQKR